VKARAADARCGRCRRRESGIRALAEEAERRGQYLVLNVLTVNQRARALYRRLGLTEVTRPGDRGIRITMRSARHGE
jgi:hypothetical protein